jgi:DnaJ-class molecular chaperone
MDEQIQCPHCNGEGEFIEADRFADDDGRRNVKHIKCEHCGGDGWIELEEKENQNE